MGDVVQQMSRGSAERETALLYTNVAKSERKRNDLNMQEIRTWSSHVFSGRSRDCRIKKRRNKDGKAVALGPRGLADGLYQTSLLRSIASYILFAGGNDQGQQKYKSENIDKENTRYLRYNCLRTDIHSPGEVGPVMPWLQH